MLCVGCVCRNAYVLRAGKNARVLGCLEHAGNKVCDYSIMLCEIDIVSVLCDDDDIIIQGLPHERAGSCMKGICIYSSAFITMFSCFINSWAGRENVL